MGSGAVDGAAASESGKSDGSATTGGDDAPAAAAVPEKYEFTLPQGVVIEDAVVEALTPAFKEAGFSNETAQKMVDLHLHVQQREVEAHAARVAEWQKDAREDPVMGGDKFEATVKGAHELVKRLLPQDRQERFFQFLNDTGYGNNNDFLYLLNEVRLAIGEDTTAGSGAAAGTESRTFAEKLYGKDPAKPSSAVVT